jgi:hypothetical protein
MIQIRDMEYHRRRVAQAPARGADLGGLPDRVRREVRDEQAGKGAGHVRGRRPAGSIRVEKDRVPLVREVRGVRPRRTRHEGLRGRSECWLSPAATGSTFLHLYDVYVKQVRRCSAFAIQSGGLPDVLVCVRFADLEIISLGELQRARALYVYA